MRGRTDRRGRSGEAGEPLRVLLYAPHFAEYALRLADGLSRKARVMLVVEKRNLANECTERLLARIAGRVELVPFDASAGFPHGPLTRRVLLPWRIRRFRPHVAHFQEQADKPTAAMLFRVRRYAPAVLTVHDPNPHSGDDTAYAEQGRVSREQLRRAAAAFHVHGAFCERELRASRVVERPVLSTPMGVHFVPEEGARGAREPGTLLFFGRMEAYKGLAVLVEAADILRRRGRAFRLVVAGRGPELDRLSGMIAAHPDIAAHDRFIGHDEAIGMFQRCSIVVAPYLDATQSAVVAAAYGNGRPVVAARVGGLVDAVVDGVTGHLVAPNDANALADAIEPLIVDDRKVDALMEGVAARADTDHDWGAIADRLLALYREILAPGAPARVADGIGPDRAVGFPSPLWGGARGGGSRRLLDPDEKTETLQAEKTPIPDPSPQGGRETVGAFASDASPSASRPKTKFESAGAPLTEARGR